MDDLNGVISVIMIMINIHAAMKRALPAWWKEKWNHLVLLRLISRRRVDCVVAKRNFGIQSSIALFLDKPFFTSFFIAPAEKWSNYYMRPAATWTIQRRPLHSFARSFSRWVASDESSYDLTTKCSLKTSPEWAFFLLLTKLIVFFFLLTGNGLDVA